MDDIGASTPTDFRFGLPATFIQHSSMSHDTSNGGSRDREEVFSKRVPAGKRTYFFDVKTTRSGDDYFITITESKRAGEGYQKHKIFIYKEDFGKFAAGLHEAIGHVRDNYLPEYDFRDLPEVELANKED